MKKLRGYINSYDEAMMVMHAARLGALDVTTERLNIDEREKIESGDIFCFIENSSGMKRWTDGRIWSPSKICGEFLIYQEVPRHLSKNSIKKQKEIERIYDKEVPYRRAIRDESLDRTTMHKKTVCIKHENKNYHIVAYYRPVFATTSLVDMRYFKKLEAALTVYPELKDDKLLEEAGLGESEAFFDKYGLDDEIVLPTLDSSKRDVLEKIALDVLAMLGRHSSKRIRHMVFQN